MKNAFRSISAVTIALLLISGLVIADELAASADVSSYMLVETENDIAMPRIEGKWVGFYDGREGRQIYDLSTKKKHDEIRQWSNIAFDLGKNYVIDAERLNMSYYHFETKNRYKWKTRYENVDHLLVGSRWLAMTWGEYDKSFRMKLHDVVAMKGRGADRRVVKKDVALADIAMERNLLVWADYRYDQAGAYLFNTSNGKTRRLSESESVTQIDTDGKVVIWKDDAAIHQFNADLGTGEILFFKAKANTIRSFKVDGDWLVYQDNNDVIYAHHRPTRQELRVSSGILHKGLVNLGDISDRKVIFTAMGKQFWVAELPESPADLEAESLDLIEE